MRRQVLLVINNYARKTIFVPKQVRPQRVIRLLQIFSAAVNVNAVMAASFVPRVRLQNKDNLLQVQVNVRQTICAVVLKDTSAKTASK